MLRIRAEQMEAFRAEREAALAVELAAYLRKVHGAEILRLPQGDQRLEALPEDQLQALVREGLIRARAYGLQSAASCYAFVTLMFVVAPNFDAQPNIQKVLKDPALWDEYRIDWLWYRTEGSDWEEARKAYDSRAWQSTDE